MLDSPCDSSIKENKKLSQRSLIHYIDFAQFYYQKVEDTASGGNWPILLSEKLNISVEN